MKIKSNGTMVIPTILTISQAVYPKAYAAICQKPPGTPMARYLLDLIEHGANPASLDSAENEIDMSNLSKEI